MQYRPDIDGIRALAVVPVVLFHAGIWPFSGGYIGVDVFFVISGYLITTILVNDVRAEKFSVVRFYDRRIRRIFPALFLMMGLCFIASWFILLPSHFEDFSESAFAAAIFLSNVQFWREAGYFGADAELAPLLHTWSLAVEEQFYVVFPLLLALIHRRGLPLLKVILAGTFFVSFFLSVYFVKIAPEAAFYLTPMRAWELMAGSILAVGGVAPITNRKLAEGVALGGAVLILVSVFSFSQETPFPGLAALLPVVGTAALIHSGANSDTVIRRVLSIRPLVFIGLVSYSFYLFHWPIFVFYRHLEGVDGPAYIRWALVFVSFFCAWLSWRFVESPFRSGGSDNAPFRVVGSGIAVSLVFLAIGFAGNMTHGWPSRFDFRFDPRPVVSAGEAEARAVMEGVSCRVIKAGEVLANGAACELDHYKGSRIALLGDSHAAHLYPGLAASFPDEDFYLYSAGGCRPIRGVNTRKDKARCGVIGPYVFDELLPRHRFDAVILSGKWVSEDVEHLPATIAYIRQFVDDVIVVGPIPLYRIALPEALALWKEDYSRLFFELNELFAVHETDRLMATALVDTGATYISLVDGMCHSGICRVFAADGETPIQWDEGHLTLEGSKYVIEKIVAPVLSTHKSFAGSAVAKTPGITQPGK